MLAVPRPTASVALVLLALMLVPAPLLPPHRVAQAVQHLTGVDWKAAYFVAAEGLQFAFYAAVGIVAGLAVKPAPALPGRLLQAVVVPLIVVGVAFVIRAAKAGHVPVLVNAVVPAAGCVFGAGLGLGLLYRRWKPALAIASVLAGATLWGLIGGVSAELGAATEARLRRLVAAGSELPPGEARFGALLQSAFAPVPQDDLRNDAVQQNRAAILALGIAVGHERLSRYVGLDVGSELVRKAVALRTGATLRGREDWARHYALSAALAVLENPLVSDAAGLMKEQLDALTHGSGFSFGDLAADRAGVRFALAATRSGESARAMQARLRRAFDIDDFFPPAADLPENLTLEQFRSRYGGVGTPRYRRTVAEIESRLDRCAALAAP